MASHFVKIDVLTRSRCVIERWSGHELDVEQVWCVVWWVLGYWVLVHRVMGYWATGYCTTGLPVLVYGYKETPLYRYYGYKETPLYRYYG